MESVKPGILGMVAALVPMVPEGLVLMTSIAFAVGVVRLGQQRCLVNELPAIEGLARVNIVCADKTGTLTESRMRLSELQLIDEAPASTRSRPAQFSRQWRRPTRAPTRASKPSGEAYPDGPNWTATSVQPFSSALKGSGMSSADASGSSAGNWLIGAPDILLDPSSAVSAQATAIGETGLRVLLLARTDIAVDSPAPSIR